jgi:hypothetical protein
MFHPIGQSQPPQEVPKVVRQDEPLESGSARTVETLATKPVDLRHRQQFP